MRAEERATLATILQHPWFKKPAEQRSEPTSGLPIPNHTFNINNNNNEDTLNSVGSTNSTGGDSLPVNYVITAVAASHHLLPPADGGEQQMRVHELGAGMRVHELENLDCNALVQMQTTPYATL